MKTAEKQYQCKIMKKSFDLQTSGFCAWMRTSRNKYPELINFRIYTAVLVGTQSTLPQESIMFVTEMLIAIS